MKTNIKQLERLYKLDSLQYGVDSLDPKKLHLAFYIKDFSFKNCLNPLFLLTRLVHKINGDYPIDHVGYIKKVYFSKNQNKNLALTIDALLSGVEENDFIDFIKHYRGKVIIMTLPKFDQKIVDDFTKSVLGLPYGEISAGLAGIGSKKAKSFIREVLDLENEEDLKDLDFKSEKIFCSFKTAILLKKLGYDIKEKTIDMTPLHVFQESAKYAEDIKLIYKN